jgi:hypothetical protein
MQDASSSPRLERDHKSAEFEPMSIEREEEALLQNGANSDAQNPARAGWQAARLRTMFVVNVASVLEKTDEQMLPSVYKYVACSLNAAPGALCSPQLPSSPRAPQFPPCQTLLLHATSASRVKSLDSD